VGRFFRTKGVAEILFVLVLLSTGSSLLLCWLFAQQETQLKGMQTDLLYSAGKYYESMARSLETVLKAEPGSRDTEIGLIMADHMLANSMEAYYIARSFISMESRALIADINQAMHKMLSEIHVSQDRQAIHALRDIAFHLSSAHEALQSMFEGESSRGISHQYDRFVQNLLASLRENGQLERLDSYRPGLTER